MELSDKELLQFAIDSGMIDTNTIRKQIEMNERKKFIEMHEYEIWQGKNGFWYTYLPDDTKGRKLVKRNTKDDIQDVIIKYYKSVETKEQNRDDVTLNEIFPEWIRFKAIRTDSSSYIKRITADWKKYYDPQKDFINTPLRKFNKIYFDEWAHGMIKENDLTKKAYYNMSMILRQCIDYAVENDYLKSNEFAKVKINSKLFRRTKKKNGDTQVYTEDEESSLIEDMMRRFYNNPASTAPLAVMFMFETGLRIGETCALQFDDIDGDYISIQRQEVREFEWVDEYTMKFKCFKVVEYTKSEDGYRDVYLTETAKKIIDICKMVNEKSHYKNKKGYIFCNKGNNVNHYSIQAMIKRGCEHLEMMVKTAHKIRKTYISTLIDSGLNIDEIRRTVGHSDERTTYGNYCFNRKTQKQTENIIEFALASKKVIKGNQKLNFSEVEKARIYAEN